MSDHFVNTIESMNLVRESKLLLDGQLERERIEENKDLLTLQEELILGITEQIWESMNGWGIKKRDLAKSLGCSASHVTQLLDGSRNMTLRTLVKIAARFNLRVSIRLVSISQKTIDDIKNPITDGGNIHE